MRWSSHAFTDAGRVRAHNEDAVLELGVERLWCVADGMGGHHDGAFASRLVVDALAAYRASRHRGIALARIAAIVARCNETLLRRAREDGVDVVGCTLAALSLHGGSALVSWCGDARIYRARRGCLRQLTRDHSAGAEREDRDRHARPAANDAPPTMLTAAVGGDSTLRLEHGWFTLDAADRFLLCTDGLVKELADEEILVLLASAVSGDQLVARLVERYRERGARDNVGIVTVVGEDTDAATATLAPRAADTIR